MPNDRPGNRRASDEAARATPSTSASQAAQEAFQNAIQSAADRIQAQGLGPELESAFSQIFDKVFDSILKSFSASASRVSGGTAASTGGGGPVTPGGAASHGTYAPSVTSSSTYAVGVRNQLAPTTVATGGVSGTRTLAGLPMGIPAGQTGVTSSASIYGLPPISTRVSSVGYSGGTGVVSGATTMAASAPGMPSYAPALAPLGTSAAGLPATAPPINPPGLPLTAPPALAGSQASVSLFPAANSYNYLITQQQIAAQNAPGAGQGIPPAPPPISSGAGPQGQKAWSYMTKQMLGRMGGAVGAAAWSALKTGVTDMQQDTISANMLQTSLGGFNAAGTNAGTYWQGLTNNYGANKYGYTAQDMIAAAQAYQPMTGGAGTAADVNRMAAFGSGTGLGLQQTAQFMGGLGQAGWIGPKMAGGQGYVPMSQMAAAGMAVSRGAGIGVNRADWEQGLYTLAQQQTAATLTTNPQQQQDLTRAYVNFNATGAPGMRGTQGAQLMGQINQGVANFQSSPYTTQQMYAALGGATGGNITPAMMGLITSSGAFVQQPGLLPKGQTVFGDIMKYANRQWGSLGRVAESYQLAPMLGVTQSQAYGILQSRMGTQGNLDQNMRDVTALAKQAHINLSSQQGQAGIATLGDIAWTLHGKNSKDIRNRISTIKGEMETQGYVFDDKKFNHMNIKQQQEYMAQRVKGGATSDADKTREAMTSLQRTMVQTANTFKDAINNFQIATAGLGPIVGGAFITVLASKLPDIIGKILGSKGGGGGGVVNTVANLFSGAAQLAGKGAGALFGGATTAATTLGGAGAAAAVGLAAGGVALGTAVGKLITMGTDEGSWLKYKNSINRFLKSPAGKGFVIKDDIIQGKVVTNGPVSIPVKSWGEVHQRMLGKENHYVLQTTGNIFSAGQSFDIGAVTTPSAASTAANATAVARHITQATTPKVAPPAAGTAAAATQAGAVNFTIDQLVVNIPENAIAKLINGQYQFPGTANIHANVHNPKNGARPGTGNAPRNNRGPRAS